MLSETELQQVIGSTAYGSDGQKIGTVGQIYLDDETGQPEWATVNTGLFGTGESFVPLSDASFEGDRLVVRHTKDKVKGAPNIGDTGHLDPDEERALYEYYGRSYETGYETTTTTRTTGDDAMTRSEERLNVGKQRVQTGRARLRKHVVSDTQTVNVPVEREELRLEREPVTDANVGDAMSGPEMTEDEVEVTLHEERPVVDKETVPVERVRAGKDVQTDTEAVSADVAREEIEVEGDVPESRNR